MCFSQFKIRSRNFETGIEGIYVVNSCAITSIEVYILPSSSRLLQHLLAVISRRHEYHSRSDSRGWNYLLWIWPIHSTSEFSRWVLEITWITAVQFCIKIRIFLYHEHVLFFLFSAFADPKTTEPFAASETPNYISDVAQPISTESDTSTVPPTHQSGTAELITFKSEASTLPSTSGSNAHSAEAETVETCSSSELYVATIPLTDLSVLVEPQIKCSLLEEDPTTPTCVPLTFTLVEKATKRRGDRLIDSMGFSYNIRRKGANITRWQCTIRRKEFYCKAAVVERNGVFTFGNFSHNHEPPKPRAQTPSRKTKTKAVVEQCKPEPTSTDEVLHSHFFSFLFINLYE